MEDEQFNFEKLKVYQKSLDFMDFVYETTLPFPMEERFNLTSQFRRAALSISLNIAEGTGASNKQNLHYLDIASRTTKECVVCNTASIRRGYIDESRHSEIRCKLVEIKKMISGLAKHLRGDN
jgi:four helix bundle protein